MKFHICLQYISIIVQIQYIWLVKIYFPKNHIFQIQFEIMTILKLLKKSHKVHYYFKSSKFNYCPFFCHIDANFFSSSPCYWCWYSIRIKKKKDSFLFLSQLLLSKFTGNFQIYTIYKNNNNNNNDERQSHCSFSSVTIN